MSGRQLRNRLVPNPSTSPNSSTSGIVGGRQLRSRVIPTSQTPSNSSGSGPRSAVLRNNVRQSTRSSTNPESCVCKTPNSKVRRRTPGGRLPSTGSARMSLGVSLRSGVAGHRLPERAANQKQKSNRSTSVKVASKQELSNNQRKQEGPAPKPSLVVFNCTGTLFSCYGENHQCTLCICPCPLALDGTCQWEGAINDVVDHITKNHCLVDTTTGPNVQIKLKNWRRPTAAQWATLQNCLGQYFLVLVEKMDIKKRPLFMGTVRVFGHQDVADRFEFRMTLKTSGNISRTFSYSTVVKPINDKTAIAKRDCFVFDSSLAENFSVDENLEVALSISVMKM